MNSSVLTSLLLPHLSSSLTDSLPSLNFLCHSKTDTRFMQVWSKSSLKPSIRFCGSIFSSLKQTFIAYRSSKVSDRIFEIHRLWQTGFSRAYSNCCCSYFFEAEIIKIGQSSHKMYSNNILNFQESMTILNACTKKSKLKGMNRNPSGITLHADTRIHSHTINHMWGCPRGVMVKAMDCGIVVSEFVLQSHYLPAICEMYMGRSLHIYIT